MDDRIKESLREVIAYLYRDEERDWEAEGKPDSDHIFLDLKRLDDWLVEVR